MDLTKAVDFLLAKPKVKKNHLLRLASYLADTAHCTCAVPQLRQFLKQHGDQLPVNDTIQRFKDMMRRVGNDHSLYWFSFIQCVATPHIADFSIAHSPLLLQVMPDDLVTYELCKKAVGGVYTAIEFVPKEYFTEELICLALRQNGTALRWVPNEYRSPKICKIAVLEDGEALKWVPDHLKTMELCREALKKVPLPLDVVPFKHRTIDICKRAIEYDPSSLNKVPKKVMAAKKAYLHFKALSHHGDALNYIPWDEVSERMVARAVRTTPTVLIKLLA